MLFELPEILQAERAGRAMALSVNTPVEAGVSPCLAGAAALAAARHIANRDIKIRIMLTESPDYNSDESPFGINLRVLKRMNLEFEHDPSDSTDYPCVISGTSMTATLGTGSIFVAVSYLDNKNNFNWDGWSLKKNPYLKTAEQNDALSSETVRDIDRATIEDYGLPGICLMENAGTGAAVATAHLARKHGRNGEIVIIAGPGNNGGDAMVVARGLLEKGLPVRFIPLTEDYQGDAAINYEILKQQPQFIDKNPGENLPQILNSARLIVDGIFGTGLDRAPEGKYAEIISQINQSETPVLALDLPSGLCARNGRELGEAIKAIATVTFHAPKLGMYQAQGPELCGEILQADIGAPRL